MISNVSKGSIFKQKAQKVWQQKVRYTRIVSSAERHQYNFVRTQVLAVQIQFAEENLFLNHTLNC